MAEIEKIYVIKVINDLDHINNINDPNALKT